mmetsp:Transcript_29051/g.60790  ORF Transcript_29051/g.60790 Transcript_29051/m.60790 type:complete len:122 (+) Transcript_29051:2157-2522(+)
MEPGDDLERQSVQFKIESFVMVCCVVVCFREIQSNRIAIQPVQEIAPLRMEKSISGVETPAATSIERIQQMNSIQLRKQIASRKESPKGADDSWTEGLGFLGVSRKSKSQSIKEERKACRL